MKADYDFSLGSSRIQRMQASPIREILDRAAALRAEGKQVIPFSAGEPNFNTPEPIKQAAMQSIAHNDTHYGSNRGLPALRSILSRHTQAETGVFYDPPEEIIVTSSGAEALNNVILTFVEDGDEVIIPTPAFVTYKNLVKYAGGVFVDIPLKPENGFLPDPDEIERHITPRTKMLILNNPNNPTGAVYPKETLEKLAALAVKYNFLILSDEMYGRLVYEDAKFTSIASLPGMKERAVIVSGFSKTYAMTGWRLGYILADRKLTAPLMRMHQYSTTCSPTFIQTGLAASLDDPETEREVQQMLEAFSRRRCAMLGGLDALPPLRYVKPYGAFYVMVDVSETGMNGTEFCKKLLETAFVATVPAIGLGDTCGDFIRISYAASDEDIVEGLRRIRAFLAEAGGDARAKL